MRPCLYPTDTYIAQYIYKNEATASVAMDDARSAPSPISLQLPHLFNHQHRPNCAKGNNAVGPCRMRIPYTSTISATTYPSSTTDTTPATIPTPPTGPSTSTTPNDDTPNELGVLGCITDFVYGREEQGRGSEHDHCACAVDNDAASSVDVNEPEVPTDAAAQLDT